MSTKRPQMRSMRMFIVFDFSCFLEHCCTYFSMLDKLLDEIRCRWHLILRGVKEKMGRSLFLVFFLASFLAMTAVQMQCAGRSYMLALLLYVRTLSDRTTLYKAAGITHQNWFNVWYGHFRSYTKDFITLVYHFIANSHRMGMELSPYVRLNDCGCQPAFA